MTIYRLHSLYTATKDVCLHSKQYIKRRETQFNPFSSSHGEKKIGQKILSMISFNGDTLTLSNHSFK